MLKTEGQAAQEGVSAEGPLLPSSFAGGSTQVVALTHEFYPTMGGIATYVMETARAASGAGYGMEVWAPDSPAISSANIPFAVSSLSLSGTQGWGDRIRLMWSLWSRREQLCGKVVWLPEPGPMRALMYLDLFWRPKRSALVLTLHGSEIDLFSSPWHRRFLFRRLLRSADRISVVSNYCRERLLGWYPEIEHKLCIAHGALRSDVRGISCPVTGALKNGRIVVLTVGRIHPRKGQLAVVEALARLEPELRERFVYRCVGPLRRPAYLKLVQEAANDAGVAFEYMGELDSESLNWQYLHSDIFAMTSERKGHSVEGFGLTYLEASAYGLPIVAHKTGGVGDAVRHGFNGLKVEPSDRAALAEAFRALSKDGALRCKLGENGRKWARSFSWLSAAHTLFAGLGRHSEHSGDGEQCQ